MQKTKLASLLLCAALLLTGTAGMLAGNAFAAEDASAPESTVSSTPNMPSSTDPTSSVPSGPTPIDTSSSDAGASSDAGTSSGPTPIDTSSSGTGISSDAGVSSQPGESSVPSQPAQPDTPPAVKNDIADFQAAQAKTLAFGSYYMTVSCVETTAKGGKTTDTKNTQAVLKTIYGKTNADFAMSYSVDIQKTGKTRDKQGGFYKNGYGYWSSTDYSGNTVKMKAKVDPAKIISSVKMSDVLNGLGSTFTVASKTAQPDGGFSYTLTRDASKIGDSPFYNEAKAVVVTTADGYVKSSAVKLDVTTGTGADAVRKTTTYNVIFHDAGKAAKIDFPDLSAYNKDLSKFMS